MSEDKKLGWKSKKSRANIIVGTESNPTQFSGGEVIINKKATKKNLDRLIEINNDGSGKKTTDASDGGLLQGPPHYDSNGKPIGGIPGVVGGVRNIETEGDEFVVNKEASEKHWKELSKINQSTGGVAINPPTSFDDDPEEYKEGGKIIFNPNKIPNKNILKYAEMVRTKYPKVWDLGGNIFGNEAFRNLKRVAERGHWEESEKWMYIKWRSYVARHIHDFRIEGTIAMLKWVDKTEKGWTYMKQLIDAEIKKRYPKKMKVGGSVKNLMYLGEVGGSRVSDDNKIDWGKNKFDEKRRFEISDKNFKVIGLEKLHQQSKSNQNKEFRIKLSEIIKHNELFKAYPELKNIEFSYIYLPSSNNISSYDFKKNIIKYNFYGEDNKINGDTSKEGLGNSTETIRGTSQKRNANIGILRRRRSDLRRLVLLHELQHFAQYYEDHGQGSSFAREYRDILRENGVDERTIGANQRDLFIQEAIERNKRHLGEMEAKDTEYRIELTLDQRKKITPFETLPYKIESVIVKTKSKMKSGGSVAQTPAPKKDRVVGSDVNKPKSSSSVKSGSSIKFSKELTDTISDKVKEHNSNNPSKKVTLAVAKAIVRRGMGAYSSSHRPTIKGGKPNDRTAWGLARLNALFYKIEHGKSKSGKYTQDDDLIEELGYKVVKYHLGGDMSKHLAPNGKPSNLTHEQWHLVRTPEFKDWFGDWENDSENASKVVDENGEPLVVYHGTYVENPFYIFDFNKADLGFHFGTYEQAKNRSETKLFFKGHKSIVNSFFLNIRNIYEVTDIGEWEYPQRYLDMFMSDNLISETDAKKLGFLRMYDRLDNSKIRDYLLKKHGNKIGFEYNNKYEGKGKSYIVLEPTQIKLVDGTNTTFDGNNPDIRFDQGGNVNKYAFVESTTTTGKKVFKLFNHVPNNKEVFEYFKTTKDEKGNPVIIEDSTIRIETFSGFDRDSFLEQANKVALKQFGSEIDDMDELMFSFDRHTLNVFPFEAELENDTDVVISVVDGVIFIEPIRKMNHGGNIEYQSRDLNGTMVYYKRDSGGKWDFISKDEFDQNANEMNTVKFDEGGKTMENTEKLIQTLKQNSNVQYGITSTTKDGEKYRYVSYRYKNPISPNWLVMLFQKAAAENGNWFDTKIFYKDNTIHYDRPTIKNMPNGSMGMKELEIIESKKDGGSVDEIKSEIIKLQVKAFKMMPNSPKQKEVIKQIDQLRSELNRIGGKFKDGGSVDEKGGLILAMGTLTTKDKKTKLDYKKVGNDFEFVVYDGESNPNKNLMNYNQFVNYLYDEGYIDDKMKDGGSVDSNVELVSVDYLNSIRTQDQSKWNYDLEKSIEQEGIREPVKIGFWSEYGHVALLDGHNRLDTAIDLGIDKIPAIVVDMYDDPHGKIKLYETPMYNEKPNKPSDLGIFKDGGSVDAKDTLTVDIPLMIRLLELSREDVHSDMELHQVVERLLDLKNKPVLTMDDYPYIAEIEHKHLKKKMDLGGNLETERLISQAHTNLTIKRGRRDYAPTTAEIQEEIDRMIMEQQFGSQNI